MEITVNRRLYRGNFLSVKVKRHHFRRTKKIKKNPNCFRFLRLIQANMTLVWQSVRNCLEMSIKSSAIIRRFVLLKETCYFAWKDNQS